MGIDKQPRCTAIDRTGKPLDRRLQDNTPLRVQRIEEAQRVEMRRSAARFVASQSTDATDCAELLAMLGLDAKDGKNG